MAEYLNWAFPKLDSPSFPGGKIETGIYAWCDQSLQAPPPQGGASRAHTRRVVHCDIFKKGETSAALGWERGAMSVRFVDSVRALRP